MWKIGGILSITTTVNKMKVKKLTETSSLNNSMTGLSRIQNSRVKQRIGGEEEIISSVLDLLCEET